MVGWEEGEVLRDIVQGVEAVGQVQKGEGGSRQALQTVAFVSWFCPGEASRRATLPRLLSGKNRSYALALTWVALLADKACLLEICQLQCATKVCGLGQRRV